MEQLAIRSILHPTDYADSGKVAFAHALRLAIAARGALHLLHVDDAGEAGGLARFPQAHETLAKWKMLDAAASPDAVQSQLGINVVKEAVASGNVAGTIGAYAENHAIDLLVMLTHGANWMSRLLKHSVAETSARLSHAPALFLREGHHGFVDAETGKIKLHRILMPVAADVAPMHAWGFASNLVRALDPGAEFNLLHIGDTIPTFGNMLPHVELRRGDDVVESILETAERHGPDLIVMATSGHHDLLDDLRGSTTERVMRQAPCPVLAIPEHGRMAKRPASA